MRTIRFRAWGTDNTGFPKTMLYDYFRICPDGVVVDSNNQNINYILMQSTGLLDKNGKEIYEGDIVRYNYGNSTVQEIMWIDGGFSLYPHCESILEWIKGIEVMGNIYETPELLK